MSLLTCFLMLASMEGMQMGSDINQGEIDPLESIIHAVMDIYNVDKTFHENFYTLLNIICPYSVQCDIENTTELNFDNLESRLNDTLYLSDALFQNRNTSSMNEARRYLKTSFINLTSCCKKCYCPSQCRENNCCPLNNADSGTAENRPLRKQHCLIPSIYADSVGTALYMVTDCLNISVSEESLRKCKYPNRAYQDEMVPVYSKNTDIIYKNKYCALCNNELRVRFWKLIVELADGVSLAGAQTFPNSSNILYQFGSRGSRAFIKLHLDFPDELSQRKEEFQCYIPPSTKYTNCADSKFLNKDQKHFFQHACSYFESRYGRYRNVFCLLCSSISLNKDTRVCSTEVRKSTVDKFTALVVKRDPPSADDVTVMVPHDSPCTCEEYYDDEKKTCRKVICPPAKDYIKCSCEPFLEDITGFWVLVFLEIFPKTPGSPVMELLNSTRPETLLSRIRSDLNKFFRNQWGPMEMMHVVMYRETSLSDRNHVKVHTLLLIRSKLATDNMLLLKTIYDFLHSGTELTILKIPMRISLGRMGDISTFKNVTSVDYTTADTNNLSLLKMYEVDAKLLPVLYIDLKYFQILKKLLFCKRITLNADEMSRLHNSTVKVGYRLDDLPYIVEVSKQQMCLDEFIHIFVYPNSASARFLASHSIVFIAIGVIKCVFLLDKGPG